MQSYPFLINQRINVLYLDTTYCNPKYRFPPKEEVLSYVVKITKKCLEKQPRTLVVVGAYSIGKECVYLAISKALGVKIYTNAPRRRILHSFDWPKLSGNLCANGKETWLHVLPISSLRFESLKDYFNAYKEYTAVLAFRPTGNLCANGKETWLHVLPISSLRFESLKDYLNAYKEYAAVLAFRPTVYQEAALL